MKSETIANAHTISLSHFFSLFLLMSDYEKNKASTTEIVK